MQSPKSAVGRLNEGGVLIYALPQEAPADNEAGGIMGSQLNVGKWWGELHFRHLSWNFNF